MTLKIEAGKYYRTRDGRKVGPMGGLCNNGVSSFPKRHDGEITCWSDGMIKFDRQPCGGDLIAEWGDEPETQPDTPKLWRDMTPEEKGALLLAEWEGKPTEIWSAASQAWSKKMHGGWLDGRAYRTRLEPKRETVTLHGAGYEWGQANEPCADDTHRITFDLIDGKPDPASIRMEELP